MKNKMEVVTLSFIKKRKECQLASFMISAIFVAIIASDRTPSFVCTGLSMHRPFPADGLKFSGLQHDWPTVSKAVASGCGGAATATGPVPSALSGTGCEL